MDKKIILMDMDGVCADFNKKMGEIAPHIFIGDGDDYLARSILVNDICKHPDNCRLFRDLEPIDGSIAAIKKLSEKYEVIFCSTPMAKVPESFTDKALWLEEHFGEWSHGRVTLTSRKDMICADYIVDDTKRNGVDKFKGIHIHYGTPDFPNWDAVLKYFGV